MSGVGYESSHCDCIPLTGDCDFESDSCGWNSIPNGLYLWTWIQASSAPTGRGPDADHTKNLGSGYYMFVDSTYGTFGMTALLISPLVLGEAGSRYINVGVHHTECKYFTERKLH